MTQRVLVTGGSGYVGRHAVDALVDRGCDVHVLTRDPERGHNQAARWHGVDILRADHPLEQTVCDIQPDICLHLAWDVSPGFWMSPANLDWVAASMRLLRAVHDAGGQRFVGAGTCGEYDWAQADRALGEDAPRAPHTLYGAAKDAVRRVVDSYCRQSAMTHAWGVLFFSFGPHEQQDRLVPSVLRNLLAGRAAMATAGTQQRDFMDSRDQGAALAALALGNVQGAVNIASGQAVAVADLLRQLAEKCGKTDLLRLGALPMRAEEPDLLLADVTRLRDQVGFCPAISLDQGLADALAWWSGRR